ncbi:hypothetical protein SUNI508_12059 [Seiridium unicorne]|uniref:Secreted protein n=1 Tax=Seiridium unicorne TaxID=138068 RepID=A0ABR2UEP5_9PEZI
MFVAPLTSKDLTYTQSRLLLRPYLLLILVIYGYHEAGLCCFLEGTSRHKINESGRLQYSKPLKPYIKANTAQQAWLATRGGREDQSRESEDPGGRKISQNDSNNDCPSWDHAMLDNTKHDPANVKSTAIGPACKFAAQRGGKAKRFPRSASPSGHAHYWRSNFVRPRNCGLNLISTRIIS